jgi:hypothetical protein
VISYEYSDALTAGLTARGHLGQGADRSGRWRWHSFRSPDVDRRQNKERRETTALWLWIITWVLLPNLGFAALWVVGSPPRYPDILATGVVGLIVRRASHPVRLLAFIGVVTLSLVMFVCRLFGMSPAYFLETVHFLIELNPLAAREYVVVSFVLLLTIAGAAAILHRPVNYQSRRSLLIASALLVLMAGADFGISYAFRGSYGHTAPSDAEFQSAVQRSGFLSTAVSGRNLVLITVEAMGAPRDPRIAQRLFAAFQRPEIDRHYNRREGRTRYYGTTTNAEVRELCGYWGNYQPLLQAAGNSCVPALLHRRGYQTTAIHGFSGDFFDRDKWYPHIGFERGIFRNELLKSGAAACLGLFDGACDRDIPARMTSILKSAKSPQFIYWLTLNSHFPVPASAPLHTARCDRFDAELARDRPMTCRMLMLWNESFAALANEVSKPGFPPTDILIVGDHMPPFYSRKQREGFETDVVPWLLLRSKAQ